MKLKYLNFVIALIFLVNQDFLHAQGQEQKNEQKKSEKDQDIKSISKEAFKKELFALICDEQKEVEKEVQALKKRREEFKKKHSALKDQAEDLYSDFVAFSKDQQEDQESNQLKSIQKRVIKIEINKICNNYLMACVKRQYYPDIIQQYQILVDMLSCYGKIASKELELNQLEKLQKLVILSEQYADAYKNHNNLLGEKNILKYKIKLLNNQCRSHKNQFIYDYKENLCKRLHVKQKLIKTDSIYLNNIKDNIKSLERDLRLSIKTLSNNIYDKAEE